MANSWPWKAYTIERAYWVPVYQHLTFRARSAEHALAEAMACDQWDTSKVDYESGLGAYVTGAWESEEAYQGEAIAIPSELAGQLDEKPLQEAPAMLAILRDVQRVINMSDPEHESYADSGADCLQALLENVAAPLADVLKRLGVEA